MIYNNMDNNSSIRGQIYNMISKLIFTIIIGLLFFMYKIDDVDKTETWLQIHSISEEPNIATWWIQRETITPMINNIKNNTWNYIIDDIKSKYRELCLQTPRICAHIQAQIPDSLEKHISLLLTIYTIQMLDESLISEKNLSQTLQSIIIKREENKQRWYANHYAIILNNANMSRWEYSEVLTHELWHIVDLWIIQGQSNQLDKQFTEFNKEAFSIDDKSIWYYTLSRESEWKRKTGEKKENFCSIYGMTNPFEDFAECFNLYIHHNTYFKYLASQNQTLQKKYNILDALLHTTESQSNNSLDNYNTNQQYRYRDSTKIIQY